MFANIRFFILSILLVAPSTHATLYYGAQSTVAVLEYDGHIQLSLRPVQSLQEIEHDPDLYEQVMDAIHYQIEFLIGTFHSKSFKQEFGVPGVLGERPVVKLTGLNVLGGRNRRIHYSYRGQVLFHQEAFGTGPVLERQVEVPLKLPRNPYQIYSFLEKRAQNLKQIKACTDSHYFSESDFWYFWDPDVSNCLLRGNDKQILRLQGTLTRLDNTVETYPEYNLLYGDNQNGKNLQIDIFVGYVLEEELEEIIARGGQDPEFTDPAIDEVNQLTRWLTQQGYQPSEPGARERGLIELMEFKNEGYRSIEPSRYPNQKPAPHGYYRNGIDFIKYLSKKITTPVGEEVEARVRILLADTSYESTRSTFHEYYMDSLETADILVYDGHSGLGANLDFQAMEKDYGLNLKLGPNKYQIYYFNGCSSYPYFNKIFYDRKGSEELEIVLSGLSTWSHTAFDNVKSFLTPFIGAQTPSYQKLMKNLEESNGYVETYLTGVVGDEDNQWTPEL